MFRNDLTAERLREVLNYTPDTGIFTRKIKTSTKTCIGEIAGCITSRGYWVIIIDKTPYLAHRLAWLHQYGVWPKEGIDHANGIKTDNRIVNLREATQAENVQNTKAKKEGGQYALGTSYRKHTGRWDAVIGVNWKQKYLGNFATQEEAHQAYAAAKLKYHTFSPVAYSQQ